MQQLPEVSHIFVQGYNIHNKQFQYFILLLRNVEKDLFMIFAFFNCSLVPFKMLCN